MKSENKTFKKAYIVTVDMGYGHQRAVYPLHDIAQDVEGLSMDGYGIINANKYGGIPKSDQRRWEGGRSIYETISRMKHLPIVGNWIFGIMDYIQRIEPFYPARDLSKPTMQVKQLYSWIKKGWGKHLIDSLNRLEHLPYITSFFTTAFFAEEHGYKGKIYCICTDTDISRAWVPLDPNKSRINYLVPNRRVKERLELYGVKTEKIFVTGFPLPKENLGGSSLKVLKSALGKRITHLDPEGRYRQKYKHTMQEFLGDEFCDDKCEIAHPLTITFAVGGAGAQRELGAEIAESLREHILAGEIRLNLVAGVKNDVYRYYQAVLKDMGLLDKKKANINIVFAESKFDYFKKFNEVLDETDILWTKPSELSFYAGLGLPIIMAPTIGSQEDFNKQWLTSIGAGVPQEDTRYTSEWLFDWLQSGWLAQAAMEGFLDAPRNGAYHVEEVALKGKRSEIEDMHLL
ncbi:hypothetical protein C0581_01420 [Candidatus Parcubacteria bacterium]|nr:MAG: hypothetical protein C0581_01420 [Candidatus Parcubacteria bacterium]